MAANSATGLAVSKRVLFSAVTGATVSTLAILVAPRLPWAGAILGGPGILASFLRFGPHSSGPDAYFFVINMLVYSVFTFLMIPKKKHPEEQANGWWPEKADVRGKVDAD